MKAYQVTEHVIGEVVEPLPVHANFVYLLNQSWEVSKIAWQGGKVAVLWVCTVLSSKELENWPGLVKDPLGGWHMSIAP